MLNLRELAGHLQISESDISVSCSARCIHRYDEVVVPTCNSIFDEDGVCPHKRGYCSTQKGECIRVWFSTPTPPVRCSDIQQVGESLIPLANLLVAV
jgi:hypothetical protein